METLNKYLGLLPTIKNSPQAVASTVLGNVPFKEMTLASIILSHLPVAWRTQYALTHVKVPESPRAILGDLENIEKLFWVSKKQATIETSVFGAEFVAMKHGIEKLRGL